MKLAKKTIIALLAIFCMVVCVGCVSFDTSGYVKAILDNCLKGESAALVEYTKSSEEEVSARYEEQIKANLDGILVNATVSDELKEEYRSFVIDLLKQTKYEVGESTKNQDGTYSVSVKTYTLQLEVLTAMQEKNEAYINELQEAGANGEEIPSNEEITENQYRITLDCLKEGLANATYSDAIDNTITISIENKLYSPSQNDLNNVCNTLIKMY